MAEGAAVCILGLTEANSKVKHTATVFLCRGGRWVESCESREEDEKRGEGKMQEREEGRRRGRDEERKTERTDERGGEDI